MPGFVVGALLAGVVAGSTVTAVGISLGFSALAFGATLVLGGLSYALQKKPKLPELTFASGRNLTVRQPISPWQIVFGRARVGGVITFLHVGGQSTTTQIGRDEQVLSASFLGFRATQQPFAADLGASYYDASGEGQYVNLVKVAGAPASGQYSVDAQGNYTFPADLAGFWVQVSYQYTQTTTNAKMLHLVITLAGHPCDAIEEVRFDDEVVPRDGAGAAQGRYAGHAWIVPHLGDPADAAQPFPALVTETGGKWSSAHLQRGRTKVWVKLWHNPDLFPQGIPNISFVVRGLKLYDPRTSSTAYGNNAAMALLAYLRDASFGLGAALAEFDTTELSAAANVCDEAVALAAGGTEPRYRVNGSFLASEKPRDVIGRLLAAMAGRLAHVGELWRISPGVYYTPTVTLDEGDLRGALRVQSLVSRRDNANGVKGLFVDPAANWQPTDFPAVQGAAYLAEDGERAWRDIDLSAFVTSGSQAQRLAKIELLRTRQALTVSARFSLAAFGLVPGRTVLLVSDRYGWSAPGKSFEVLDWQFAIDEAGRLAIDLALRESAAAVYDWSTSDELPVDIAPNTSLPDPFFMPPITGLALDSGDAQLLATSEGSIVSRIRADWNAPPSPATTQIELRYRLQGAVDWIDLPPVKNTTHQFIAPVEDGTTYEVAIRGRNGLGVAGAWSIPEAHLVVGKTAPPPDVDTFTVDRLADGTRRYAWTMASVPADVRAGGGWRIRYKSGSTSDWNAMTPLHEGLLVASPWESNALAAGTYTWAIKTVDSSGNESTAADFITGTIGDPRLRNVLIARLEHELLWPGTRTGFFLLGSSLISTSAQTIADLPATISALAATIDGMTTNTSPASYETPVLDLGANTTFTPLVTPIGEGTITITMKTGTEADGAPVGAYGALAQVIGKRYIQIRLEVAGAAPRLDQATILLDGDVQIDEFENVNTATESATWFNKLATGHFQVGSKSGQLVSITFAQLVALQNVGAGYTWELISKAVTVNGEPGAEFKIRNAAGTLADATVDIQLKGPKG